MKRFGLILAALLLPVWPAGAQSPVTVTGPITVGDCAQFASVTIIKDAGVACGGGGGGGIVIGSTTVTGAGAGQFLFNSSGVAGAATLGTMAIQNAGAVAITGGTITGLGLPSSATDAASKQYVDNSIVGLIIHSQALLATTAALPANTYSNGTAGVGATLTGNSFGALSVDGVLATVSARIVVKNEAAPANNGIYDVTAAGDGSHNYVLTRAADANTPGTNNPAEIGFGTYVFVTSGSTNADTGWSVTSTITTIGTSAINWAQFSVSGAGPNASLPCLNIVSFGADPTGASDSAGALNSAIAALPAAGGCISVPAGHFKVNSSITVTYANTNQSISISGAGQDATTFNWPNASGGFLFIFNARSQSVHVSNMSITTDQASGGNGIEIRQTICSIFDPPQNDISRVTFRPNDDYGLNSGKYWTSELFINNSNQVYVDGSLFYGNSSVAGGIGIEISGSASLPCPVTIVNVQASSFFYGNTGIQINGLAQGITVNQTNFENVINGINVPSSTLGFISLLVVSNSQFGALSDGMLLLGLVDQIQITNNAFFAPTNASCMHFAAGSFINFTGNQCSTEAGATGTFGFVFNTIDGIITGNMVTGITSAGIWLQTGSSNMNVQSNFYNGNGGTVLNQGTSNTVGGGSQ